MNYLVSNKKLKNFLDKQSQNINFAFATAAVAAVKLHFAAVAFSIGRKLI